jgi:YebC/PmpR family DNA-binding regulatory protein
MSGHSKWAQIKRKKAVTDTRRGKIFNHIIREITIASKMGGGDPDGNPRLRFAIEKAKENNMPADNIKRAIMKGTGELPGMAYEDATYEIYGPGGVALIVETITDNKTRTVSEIRHILDRNHGKLASTGSVAFQFHRKGIVVVPRTVIPEDDLLALALDAGAEDVKTEDEVYTILCAPDVLENLKQVLTAKAIRMEHAELQLLPENSVRVEGKEAENLLKLVESIEEHDDVQHVYGNFDVDEKVLLSFHTN